eukprot:238363_1
MIIIIINTQIKNVKKSINPKKRILKNARKNPKKKKLEDLLSENDNNTDEEYTMNIEEKNEYSNDNSVQELVNGFDDNTNNKNINKKVNKKVNNKKKKKKNKNKVKDNVDSDISIEIKPKKRRKSKPKGEYNKEQIEFVFNTLDEEGNGIISVNNVMHGFRSVNQNDVSNWECAKKMLDYADKQYDNDFQVRFDDFLSMCRLANLCYE